MGPKRRKTGRKPTAKGEVRTEVDSLPAEGDGGDGEQDVISETATTLTSDTTSESSDTLAPYSPNKLRSLPVLVLEQCLPPPPCSSTPAGFTVGRGALGSRGGRPRGGGSRGVQVKSLEAPRSSSDGLVLPPEDALESSVTVEKSDDLKTEASVIVSKPRRKMDKLVMGSKWQQSQLVTQEQLQLVVADEQQQSSRVSVRHQPTGGGKSRQVKTDKAQTLSAAAGTGELCVDPPAGLELGDGDDADSNLQGMLESEGQEGNSEDRCIEDEEVLGKEESSGMKKTSEEEKANAEEQPATEEEGDPDEHFSLEEEESSEGNGAPRKEENPGEDEEWRMLTRDCADGKVVLRCRRQTSLRPLRPDPDEHAAPAALDEIASGDNVDESTEVRALVSAEGLPTGTDETSKREDPSDAVMENATFALPTGQKKRGRPKKIRQTAAAAENKPVEAAARPVRARKKKNADETEACVSFEASELEAISAIQRCVTRSRRNTPPTATAADSAVVIKIGADPMASSLCKHQSHPDEQDAVEMFRTPVRDKADASDYFTAGEECTVESKRHEQVLGKSQMDGGVMLIVSADASGRHAQSLDAASNKFSDVVAMQCLSEKVLHSSGKNESGVKSDDKSMSKVVSEVLQAITASGDATSGLDDNDLPLKAKTDTLLVTSVNERSCFLSSSSSSTVKLMSHAIADDELAKLSSTGPNLTAERFPLTELKMSDDCRSTENCKAFGDENHSTSQRTIDSICRDADLGSDAKLSVVCDASESEISARRRLSESIGFETIASCGEIPLKKRKVARAEQLTRPWFGVSSSSMCIGNHVSSAAASPSEALHAASSVGARAVGLFLRPQREWKSEHLTPQEIAKFQQSMKDCGYSARVVVPHGSFLINVGSSDAEWLRRSRELLVDELRRCHMLGLSLFNFHPGSFSSGSLDSCIRRIADNINYAHHQTRSVVTVLENTCGASGTVGGRFDHLKQIIALVTDKSRIGVCLDTCHAFAAGYDISSEEGYDAMMRELEDIVGLQYLKAVHINDSKDACDSHLDHHECVGRGKIGADCFRLLVNDRRLERIPMILETPNRSHGTEIQELYKLIE